jgi:two-component system, NtrC family, sensor kinase
MMGVVEKIPSWLTVCVLVMVFACLKRHTRSARLTLWALGWTLVSIHFLAQLLAPVDRHAIACLRVVDAGALQLAAITFLLSVSSVAEDRRRRTLLFLTLAIPSVSYAVLHACRVPWRWPYAVCLMVCWGGSAAFFCWCERRFRPLFFAMTLVGSLAGAWAFAAAVSGSFEEGRVVLLALGFVLAAVFICRNYWAPSPALLTIAIGFFLWGASLPVLYLVTRYARMALPPGLWDVPELLVAFGMILAVVEDKSNALTGMQHQAAALQRQLESFSAISSRLLTTTAPDSILDDIASTITDVTSFRSVLIHIESAEKTLRLAASSGVSREFVNALEERTGHRMATQSHVPGSNSRPISRTSFLVSTGQGFFALEGNPFPQGSELLIPLRSAAGACLGSISLLSAGFESSIPVEELARIESLAIDLSVAIELKSLYTQLVFSEKLAAMGQLVAGVAHELNNPLTAIMGFGELISDAITSARTSDQLERLLSETRRMKRLTDTLLRFSRHTSADAASSQLAPVVHEVLALCEYQTRKSHLTVETEIAPDLPSLAIHEDEIKQVLLNLFSNSCDALNDSGGAKQIKIRAHRVNSRAVIQVEDTGPGFSNLHRALDPFYTTKPEGKGTGLGLSICYGIAKRRGGDLRIENVKPQGARVTWEVPVSEPHSNPCFAATARA